MQFLNISSANKVMLCSVNLLY